MGALAFLHFLACQAGSGAGLCLQAPCRYGLAAALALAEGAGLEAFKGRVDCRNFSGIASCQPLAPLAQDSSPAINFFR